MSNKIINPQATRNRIHRLSPDVINKIAAGEVVERPASIIKELLENSIDAKATEIQINIRNGGIDLIEIIDNGLGIAKDDLPLLLERHTTSKINDISDLNTIASFGFRGEALSSIGAVSKIRIHTKPAEQDLGYVLENYPKTSIKPKPRQIGTTITVSDLFYNVPARRKFLKSANTEYRHVLYMIENFALVYPNIRFILRKDNKEIFDFFATKDFAERVQKVLGYNAEDLIFYDTEDNYFGIKVVLLHPRLLSERSKFIRIFVNNRYIEDKNLVGAIKQGITDYIPHSYKPSALLFLNLPASYIDVNVHPRKTEIKFANPYRVFAFVKGNVKHAIAKEIKQGMRTDYFSNPNQNLKDTYNNINSAQSGFKPIRSVGQSNKKELEQTDIFSQDSGYNRLRSRNNNDLYGTTSHYNNGLSYQSNNLTERSYDHSENYTVAGSEILHEITSVAETQEIVKVLQILNRYILVEWEDEVWLIDQHAAAERIRYEQLLKAFNNSRTQDLQTLLIGPSIVLSASELELTKDKQEILNKLGFEYNITENSVKITAIPTFIKQADIERVFRDLLSQLKDYEPKNLDVYNINFVTDNKFSKVVATIACHSSIRANEKMQEPEIKRMIQQLLECKIPYACPHGRRLIWRLTSEDIDKQFMRT